MSAAHVYQAINLITAEMSKEGISKDHRNAQQNYSFRGIDDVYGALAPKLAAHGLCILPRVQSRETVERQTLKGGTLFYTTLLVEFDFVSSVDGTKHTVCTVGEAMDSADKSSNKAMSAAFKYAAFQSFCIPTEGDNDADATTHEVRGGAHQGGNGKTSPTPPTQTPRQETKRSDGPPAASQGELGICPKCGGDMWDNRTNKKNPKAPDWKCKDKQCDGVIWPPKESKPRKADDGPPDGFEPPPFDPNDDVPF